MHSGGQTGGRGWHKEAWWHNALKIQIQMSSSPDEESYTLNDDSLGALGNLRPPEQEEKATNIKRKPGLAWLKTTEKQNPKGKKQPKQKKSQSQSREYALQRQQAREKRQQRSRSRSRQRRPDSMQMLQPDGLQRDYIEISDDQEADAKLISRYYRVGNEYYLKGGFEGMNWRERRKLERLFAREEKNYLEGKVKDQLSFTLFNTIECYFR